MIDKRTKEGKAMSKALLIAAVVIVPWAMIDPGSLFYTVGVILIGIQQFIAWVAS